MIDIDLKIVSPKGQHKATIGLYFGEALGHDTYEGWHWVEQQGMTVNPPSAYDRDSKPKSYRVTKQKLKQWVADGYLTTDMAHPDSAASFLAPYSDSNFFILSFIDWS